MLLTSDLAQQIVDNIMPIAQQNINIMDSQGIIIGSGHTHRLHTFHKGAKDVIDIGQVVEIYPAELELYPGSLPGLNMPIFLNDQIIGVVGVSGHPDEVRSTAKMVKMVTELILEREILREEFLSHSQLQEYFAALLLSDHANANFEKLSKTAKLLNYQLELPRMVVVADVQPLLDQAFHNYGLNDLISSRTKESLTQLVTNSPHITSQDLVVFIENKLVVVKHFPETTAVAMQKHWGTDLLNLLQTCNNNVSLSIGIGSLSPSYNKLILSYQEALFSLSSCTIRSNITSIHDFDILAAYLIRKLNNTNSCLPLEKIKAKLDNGLSKKYDMKNTIISLLDNHLNVSSTAKSLFIHRNTLLFRLEKLKDATGLDPCRFLNHAILCKILYDD